ncbi:MAG: hypothetical protein HYY84_16575 [Deltaproteobacteria bacterium]|nr:hypothetical protein [Deltaproteobacteria bacterium]
MIRSAFSLSAALLLVTQVAVAETPANAPGTPVTTTAKSLVRTTEHGLGFRAGYSVIPAAVLKIAYKEASKIDGFTLAGFWTRRFTPFFSLVTTLAGTKMSSAQSVWLQDGKTDRAADIVNINMWILSADATADFDMRVAKWFAFHAGVGLGIGIPIGASITTQDALQCPAGYVTVKDCTAAAGTPVEEKNMWPVVPIINLVTGFRVDFTDFLTLRADFAIRDGFIFQGGLSYNF